MPYIRCWRLITRFCVDKESQWSDWFLRGHIYYGIYSCCSATNSSVHLVGKTINTTVSNESSQFPCKWYCHWFWLWSGTKPLWTITHYLRLGHETLVRCMPLYILIWTTVCILLIKRVWISVEIESKCNNCHSINEFMEFRIAAEWRPSYPSLKVQRPKTE